MPTTHMMLFLLISITAGLKTAPFTPPSDTSNILGRFTEIDQRLVGTFDYDIYMYETLHIGHLKETVEQGEHQGQPVYFYSDESVFSFGPFKDRNMCSSIVATDFTVLRSECREQSTDPDKGDTDSIRICETSRGELTCTVTKNQQKPETTTFQLPSGTPYFDETLAMRVVDLEPGQTLSSVSFDEDEKTLVKSVMSRTGTARATALEGDVDAAGFRMYSPSDNESMDFLVHNARILKTSTITSEGIQMSMFPSYVQMPDPEASTLAIRDPASLSPRDVATLFIIHIMNKDAQKITDLLDFEYMYDTMQDIPLSFEEFKSEFTKAFIPEIIRNMENGDADLDEFKTMFPDRDPALIMEIVLSHTMIEKIQGDMAQVYYDETDKEPMQFHKTDQGWKIVF